MLVHCTENFQSIHFISFSNETFAKQQEAMQLEFHQSYTIKGTQNFHYFHPTQMKGMGPISIHFATPQLIVNPNPFVWKEIMLQLCMTKHGALA